MNEPIAIDAFLQSLGINLDTKACDELVDSFEKSLMENVIESVTDELSEDQLLQLETLLNNQEDGSLQEWLTNNVPNLKEIVQDEVDILLGDIAEKSDQL